MRNCKCTKYPSLTGATRSRSDSFIMVDLFELKVYHLRQERQCYVGRCSANAWIGWSAHLLENFHFVGSKSYRLLVTFLQGILSFKTDQFAVVFLNRCALARWSNAHEFNFLEAYGSQKVQVTQTISLIRWRAVRLVKNKREYCWLQDMLCDQPYEVHWNTNSRNYQQSFLLIL